MTVMDNEDPALPETTEGEAWYDAEIAPALAALAGTARTRSAEEVRNLVDLGVAMIDVSMAREESRGCHTREDFPDASDRFRLRLLLGG